MPPPNANGHSFNGSAETVLIRLDERMKTMVAAFERLEQKVENDLVTKSEFVTVQKLVYGAAGAILLAVVGALVALVVQAGGAP